MYFVVNQIEFDFTDDLYEESLDLESQDEIYEEVLNTEWYVVDEEDLVDEITDRYGWCIKSIDYKMVEDSDSLYHEDPVEDENF